MHMSYACSTEIHNASWVPLANPLATTNDVSSEQRLSNTLWRTIQTHSSGIMVKIHSYVVRIAVMQQRANNVVGTSFLSLDAYIVCSSAC